MDKIIKSNPKITTEGLMNGEWQIVIKGIRDSELYNIEVAILKLFNRKKKLAVRSKALTSNRKTMKLEKASGEAWLLKI